MSEQVHVLVVRVGGLEWALPMTAVEQTFNLGAYTVRRAGGGDIYLTVRCQFQVAAVVAQGIGDFKEPAEATPQVAEAPSP